MNKKCDRDDLLVTNLALSGSDEAVMSMIHTHLQVGLHDQQKSLKSLLAYFAQQHFDVTPLLGEGYHGDDRRTYVVKLSQSTDDEVLLQCYVDSVDPAELPFDFEHAIYQGRLH